MKYNKILAIRKKVEEDPNRGEMGIEDEMNIFQEESIQAAFDSNQFNELYNTLQLIDSVW